MKHLAFFLTVLACCLLLVGCNGTYLRESEPQNVYIDHIDTTWSPDVEYSQNVAAVRGATVVSIISNFVVYTGMGNRTAQQILSGVIINEQGYILTSSQSAESTLESGTSKRLSVYAVLPEIYNMERQFKLSLVDYDNDAGLALFKFYDDFFHYVDEEKSEAVSGFQIYAEFSGQKAITGERCVTIGNSLGNTLSNGAIDLNDVELTVMNGIISAASADAAVLEPVLLNGNSYNYILTSSPVNFDMYGGGMFDESGYLLGTLAFKIGYQASSGTGESGYFARVSAAYPIELIVDYIDSAAIRVHAAIPYTLALPDAAMEEAA